MVGMTNFKGDYVTKGDVKVAKNYLSERELQVLNLLVSQFLDFAELQALEECAMTMAEWVAELDRQLLGNRRELLTGKGRISHKNAVEKAEKEFELYRAHEMRQLESDFDRAVKELTRKDAGGTEMRLSDVLSKPCSTEFVQADGFMTKNLTVGGQRKIDIGKIGVNFYCTPCNDTRTFWSDSVLYCIAVSPRLISIDCVLKCCCGVVLG
jgi:hypothetical protein